MLIERWERFRNVDKWPEVRAVIIRKKSWYMPGRVRPGRFLTSIEVEYQTIDGLVRLKTIRFLLMAGSGIDALDTGDWFYVRCCPQDTSKIYVRESTQDKIKFAGRSLCS